MARVSLVAVTLSAGQAAGTTPILAAETGAVGTGTRKLLRVISKSAAATDLFFVSGGAAGNGIPLAIAGQLDTSLWPPFDGDLFIVGATAAEKVILVLG